MTICHNYQLSGKDVLSLPKIPSGQEKAKNDGNYSGLLILDADERRAEFRPPNYSIRHLRYIHL